MNKLDRPITLPIEDIIEEAQDIKSFVFRHKFNAKPGQFILLWIPNVNEKPFGVSYQDKEKFMITVCKVGKATEVLHKMKKGDLVGIRGPYGTNFELEGKNIVLVGGGYGTAPLFFLANQTKKRNVNVDFIIGAKSEKFLIFRDKIRKLKIKLHITTDDGTCGEKCFTTDVLEKLLNQKKIDIVYGCGPELMLKKLVDICKVKNIPSQISLERYIKCGMGICGQCCVDPLGLRMCKEGPVISGKVACKIFEFGKYKRDASGKKINI